MESLTNKTKLNTLQWTLTYFTYFKHIYGLQVGYDHLVTEAGREEWETYKQYNKAVTSLFSNRASVKKGHDTVGAVALDKVRSLERC